jgi:hypothetical protein
MGIRCTPLPPDTPRRGLALAATCAARDNSGGRIAGGVGSPERAL